MIDQITVYLENKQGRLAALCRTLGDAGINMHALTIADTTDYGVARIICDDPARAVKILDDDDWRASITKVAAVEVPNEPGGLAGMLDSIAGSGVNVEYSYCFATPSRQAVFVMKVHGGNEVLDSLTKAGYKALQPSDLYADH